MTKKEHHILGLSGGKDSTALAVHLHKKIPNMKYFFCDTGEELPETYEYLNKIKARLNIEIKHLAAERGFQHWLDVYNGYLPSPQARWCTKQMKILPLENYIEEEFGDDIVYSYVGIRADEPQREGYLSKKTNIITKFPFRDDGIAKDDVIQILDDSGLGLPKYYEWRSRSGCYFCFYQRKYEWVKLAERHPELFEKAKQFEQEHADGRMYSWSDGETLDDLIARKDEIIANHEKALARHQKKKPNQALIHTIEDILNEEDDELPCLACHL